MNYSRLSLAALFTCCALGCSQDSIDMIFDYPSGFIHAQDYILQVSSNVIERTPRPSYCVRLSSQYGVLSLPGMSKDSSSGACGTKSVCQLKANNLGKTNWILIYRNDAGSNNSDILTASLFSSSDCATVDGSGPLASIYKVLHIETADSKQDLSAGMDGPSQFDMTIKTDL